MSEHGGSGGGSPLREIAAIFGIEVEGEGLEHLHEGIDGAIHQLHELAEVLLEGAFVEGVREFVNETAEMAEQLHLSATTLGLSTESLQSWRYAASLNGVEAGELNASLAIFQRNSQGAISGNAEMARTFRSLGVNIRDAHGNVRGLDDLLPEVATHFSEIENPTERTAVAMRLFGRSGARLVPLLNQGAEGLAEMRGQMEELGGGASEQMIENSVRLVHEQHRLDLAWFSLRSRIANGLLPMFTRLTEIAVAAVSGFSRLTAGTHVIQIALAGLVGTMTYLAVTTLTAFAAPLLTVAAFVIAIGFVILVIDDLVGTFEGGNSVIRTFVDELFGVGTTAQLVDNALRNLQDTWNELTSGTLFQDFVRELHDAQQPGGVAQATTAGLSPEQNAAEQRRQAALRGEVVGRPGQTYAQAEADANRARQAAGIPTSVSGAPLGQGGVLAPAALTASVPAIGQGGPRTVSISSPVSITVPQGTDASQVAAFRTIMTQTLDERNRQAAAILGREAVE